MLLPLALLLASHKADPFDAGPRPLLMRHPTVNATDIVFQFAGNLWSVPRAGGAAVRITDSDTDSDTGPVFSPDGTQIAFTGNYDGNQDVFVMPAKGGVPKRLTTHPANDIALGWTPDGKSVLFSSSMFSDTDYARLFTVPVSGGVPTQLPFPAGVDGSFSPDGKRIALVPNPKWELAWKRYRGGQTWPIWIGDLATSKIAKVPRKDTNDFNPMWVGDSIYYLSDPTGPVGMNRYDVSSGKTSVVIPGEGFDLKSASAGPGAIVYERLGSIHLYDLKSGDDHAVPISISGDFPEVRSEFKDLRQRITSVNFSPTGQRVLVSARGWVFTAPAAKGSVRQIGGNQGYDRTDAAWSPNGKTIAYIEDAGEGEHLALYDIPTGTAKTWPLGDAPGDYRSPVWSPDSTKLAYTDNKLNLWVIDAATGKNTLIDTGSYRGPSVIAPQWSPDSKWLTWSRDLKSLINAVFLYSFDSGKKTQVTDGMGDATWPVFDRGGKYLYFIGCTNIGFGIDYEDLESMAMTNTTSSIYAVLLRKDMENPLHPESDEEKIVTEPVMPPKSASSDSAQTGSGGAAVGKDAVAPKEKPFSIDLDGIGHRILALPFPQAGYQQIVAGPADSLFVLVGPPRATPVDNPGPASVQKFSFSDRKIVPFADGVRGVMSSYDGKKLLLANGSNLRIVGADAPPAPGSGAVDLSDLKAKVDPPTEWKAMYHQVWRKERLLFYDPGLHGIDANVMEKRYEPFLAGIRSREDLNYLFTDMLGEICIGHMFIGGGDIPRPARDQSGLLGADFAFEHGRYRITRVYDGESWNPSLASPLGSPGVNAKAGEYLLAIDGQNLTDKDDIWLALEGKAGKQVSVKLGPTPDGVGSREAVVVPVASEFDLRNVAWEEDNRRYVAKETGGKAGYVHVPDTGGGGWVAFMRYYYSQLDKQAMVVDDRFNHGGYINDFMIREMEKPLDFYGATRYGDTFRVPMAAIYGPKVMLVNEMAGSGGDLFPYLFRTHRIGKLVGKKTWGGELSAYGFPLIDGGSVRAPDDAEFDPVTNRYVIDNVGVPPDIDVDLDPAAWRDGVDLQLQTAVAELKKEMAAHPLPPIKRPPYPDKSKLPQGG